MNYRKHGLKALGLSILAALSLMAFTAAGAQAQEWLVGALKTFKEHGLASETITGKQEGVGRLLILKLNLLLKCEETAVTGATVVAGGTGSGTINFTKCYTTDLNLKKGSCVIAEPVTAKVKAQVFLHPEKGKALIRFSPAEGETFATVKSSGAFCTLPKEASVKGSVVAEIKVEDVAEVLISTKLTLTLFPSDVLFYGTNEGHLEADALVKLTGPLAGQPWGAI